MDARMIGSIVILVLLLVVVGAVIGIILYIRSKVREFSQNVFGTENVMEGFKKQELEYASKPKSVSGATGLYLPQITRDFPEFHADEMRNRAEQVLTSFLQGIDTQRSNLLTEGTRELKDKLEMKIVALRDEGCQEHFERIKIHRTEINRYSKEKGRCRIVYQSAVGCIHYVEKNGKVIRGKKDVPTQHRYNIELCYIQDRDLVENSEDKGYALVCPNCGGPLKSLGAKVCPYCDSPVVEFNIHTWEFTDVEVLK